MSPLRRSVPQTPVDSEAARAQMVEHQLHRRGITDERVLAAMGRVPRELFVPEDLRGHAYEDGALPIGLGQTISQPYIVGAICQLLALSGDERVLDVGTGSGYQAAVLAELAAEVVTIERLPELAARARAALVGAGLERVEVLVGDGSRGVPERAPYDAVAVAAAAPEVPGALYEQLAAGGRLVLPRGSRFGQELVLVVRTADGPVERASVPCRFVPLVGDEGFSGA
jgi:protein-L-isoaspartate(D-aspartate) O-methyltransferase